MLNAEVLYNEGLDFENKGDLEKAFQKYELASALNSAESMAAIARLYVSGKFRPVTTSNLGDLLLNGPIFPWSIRNEKKPDYKSAIKWLEKAAALGHAGACSVLGNMLANGVGCAADENKALYYLEKAVSLGDTSAEKYIHLLMPDGKTLTDEEYEKYLSDFESAVLSGDDWAYKLYSALRSGTDKQLSRLGYVLMAGKNAGIKGFEPFKVAFLPSGIPLLPVAPKRVAWETFIRIDLNGFKEKYPLIAVSSDILDPDCPQYLLTSLYKAQIVGKAKYISPDFGWLNREKEAVVIRLGVENTLDKQAIEKVRNDFYLISDEYEPENVAFFAENGEKEYSFEIAGINGDKVDVLWRYTIGGSDRVDRYFEPELIELTLDE